MLQSLGFITQELEADGMEVDDSIVYEIAANVMREYSGVEKYLLDKFGVSDAQCWIADRI